MEPEAECRPVLGAEQANQANIQNTPESCSIPSHDQMSRNQELHVEIVPEITSLPREHVPITNRGAQKEMEDENYHRSGESVEKTVLPDQGVSQSVQYVQGNPGTQYRQVIENIVPDNRDIRYMQTVQVSQGTGQYGEALSEAVLPEGGYEKVMATPMKDHIQTMQYETTVQEASNNQVVELVESVEGGDGHYIEAVQIHDADTGQVAFEQVLQVSGQNSMPYRQTLFETREGKAEFKQPLHSILQIPKQEEHHYVRDIRPIQASFQVGQLGQEVQDPQDIQTLQNIQIAQILQSMRGMEQNAGSQVLSSVGNVEEVHTSAGTADQQVVAILQTDNDNHAENIPEVAHIETVQVMSTDHSVQEVQVVHNDLQKGNASVYSVQSSTVPTVMSDQTMASMWSVDLQHLLPSQFNQPQQVEFKHLSGPNVQVEPVQPIPPTPSASLESQTTLQSLTSQGPTLSITTSGDSRSVEVPVVVMNSSTGMHQFSAGQDLMLPAIESVEVTTSTEESKQGSPSSSKPAPSMKREPLHARRITSIEKPYGCGVCQMAFAVPAQVKVHLLTHSPEEVDEVNDKIFKCPVCGMAFSRSDNLKRHTRFHADNSNREVQATPKPFECPICNMGFSRADTYRRHVRAHSEPYEPQRRLTPKGGVKHHCATCGETMSDKTARLHHDGAKNLRIMLLKCDECGDMFCRKNSLEKHQAEKHPESAVADNGINPAKVIYSCQVCSLLFSSMISLNRHSRVHKTEQDKEDKAQQLIKIKTQPGEPGKKLKKKKKNVKNTMRSIRAARKVVFPNHVTGAGSKVEQKILTEPLEKPYGCIACPETFASPIDLKKHVGRHTNIATLFIQNKEPCRCPVCNKNFNRMDNLKRHTRVHTGDMPHKCTECDFNCQRLSTLRDHQLAHVTGTEFPYACSQCNKAFSRKHSLMTHMFLHLGLRPFVCTVCQKTFTRNFLLKEHSKIHTGERPFKCPECDVRFRQRSTMIDHRKTHYKTGDGRGRRKKDRVCPECGVVLFSWYGYKAHVDAHKGLNKDNCCLVCGKLFTTPYNVKHHMGNVHKLSKEEISDMFAQKEEERDKYTMSETGEPYEVTSSSETNNELLPTTDVDDKENIKEAMISGYLEEVDDKDDLYKEEVPREEEKTYPENDQLDEVQDSQGSVPSENPELEEAKPLIVRMNDNSQSMVQSDGEEAMKVEMIDVQHTGVDIFHDSQTACVDHNYGDGRRPGYSDHKYE